MSSGTFPVAVSIPICEASACRMVTASSGIAVNETWSPNSEVV
jgi:hypothetical protein